MNRFIPAVLLSMFALGAAAQTDVDGMSLSGLATFQQLRTDYYIGALYLPEPAKTADDAFYMPGRKRMDIRVVTESWSKRRFTQQWNQLILINNTPDTQKSHRDNIIAFASMLKDDLRAGDRITIDHYPDEGTKIRLNGTPLITSDDPSFFNLLLSCWIGARPPSSGFKQDLLRMPTGPKVPGLLSSFEVTAPTQARIVETKSWGATSVASSQPNPEPAPAAVEPEPKADPGEAKRRAAERARREAEAAEKARLAKLEAERQRKQAIARALAEAEAKAKAEARSKALINEYSSSMVRASYSHVRYPKRALKLNQEGTVLLEVIIKRDGRLISSRVIQSSGYSALDDAAVSAVEKTAPFPVIPEGISGNQIEFTLPFTFQISG